MPRPTPGSGLALLFKAICRSGRSDDIKCRDKPGEGLSVKAVELLAPALTDNLPSLYDNRAEAISPGRIRRTATENTTAAQSHKSECAFHALRPRRGLTRIQLFRDAIRDVAHARSMVVPRSLNVDWALDRDRLARTAALIRRDPRGAAPPSCRGPVAQHASAALGHRHGVPVHSPEQRRWRRAGLRR